MLRILFSLLFGGLVTAIAQGDSALVGAMPDVGQCNNIAGESVACEGFESGGSPALPGTFQQSQAARDFFTWEQLLEESRQDRYLYIALFALACYPFFWLLKKTFMGLYRSSTASYIAKIRDELGLEIQDASVGELNRAKKERAKAEKTQDAERKNAMRNVAFVLLKHPASVDRAQHIVREDMRQAGLEILEEHEGDIQCETLSQWSDDVQQELISLGAFRDKEELLACGEKGAKVHYWSVSWGAEKYGGSWPEAVSQVFGISADGVAHGQSMSTVHGKLQASWSTIFPGKPVPPACGLAVSRSALVAMRLRQLCLGTAPGSDPFGSALVDTARVDPEALKTYWLDGGSARHSELSPTGSENASHVLMALQSSGTPAEWRRPGGEKRLDAISFGTVSSNSIVVPTGSILPGGDGPQSARLRAVAHNLSFSGGFRVLLVPGSVEELHDAVAWIRRGEKFVEKALEPENIRSLDGRPAMEQEEGAKVEAQFGGSGPWRHGVVEALAKKRGCVSFTVRFFNDVDDEGDFDKKQAEKKKQEEEAKIKETQTKASVKEQDIDKAPQEAEEVEEEDEDQDKDTRVGLLGLESNVSSLVLLASAKARQEVAACIVIGLGSGEVPAESDLRHLASPLQAHISGSKFSCYLLARKLKARLASARMLVKTYRAPPTTVFGKLRELFLGVPGDNEPIPVESLLRKPLVTQRALRQETHNYRTSVFQRADFEAAIDAVVLRRCIKFYKETFSGLKSKKLSDDERKEQELTRVSTILARFGKLLGPAAWRDRRFQNIAQGEAPPKLTLIGKDARTPGLLDCPATLMLFASALAVLTGVIGSIKMRKTVFFMQAVSTGGFGHDEKVTLGMEIMFYGLLEWLLNMPKESATRAGGQKVTMVLKELCFHTLLQQDVAYAEQNSVEGMSRLLHHYTGVISSFLSHKFPELLSCVSCFSSGVSFLMYFCPHLLVHFLALAIFKVEAFMALFHAHEFIRNRRHKDREEWPKDRSGETLSNFKAVRAYNTQDAAEKDFSSQLAWHANRGKKDFLNPFELTWMCLDFSFQYFDMYSKIYTGRLVMSGVIGLAIAQEMLNTGGELVWRTWWMMEQFGVATPPWANSEDSWVQAGAALLALFEREPPISLDEGEWDASNVGEFRGEIELKGVTFRYPPKDANSKPEAIFEDFSVKIAGGTKVGLVGPSGGGKTTTLALIQRFYDPEKGEVLLDGRPLKSYKPSFLSSIISVVQQDAAIFDMTVAENIRWGKPDATEAEIEDALVKAALYHDLDRKPLRFDTPATELSGGQKQRLTIARAIVRKPKILLLDEATAALDTKSEREVQKALNALMADVKGTCVAIAHRLSTIMDSDSIAVVKNKKVVEQGSHSELVLKEGGEYAELSRLAGMGGGDAEKGEEEALQELEKMIIAEAERDPGSTFLPLLQKKLKAAKAWTEAERKHLKELSQTYEKALQKHLEDHNAEVLQATVEQATAGNQWSMSRGKAVARFATLPPLDLSRQSSAPGPRLELMRQTSAPFDNQPFEDGNLPDLEPLLLARATSAPSL